MRRAVWAPRGESAAQRRILRATRLRQKKNATHSNILSMTRIKREIVQRGNLNPTFYELNIFTVYLIIKISRFKREKKWDRKMDKV